MVEVLWDCRRKRTFFQKVWDLHLAELPHIFNVAIVPEERENVVGENVGIRIRPAYYEETSV